MVYCTLQDVRSILPENIVIGTNLNDTGVNILEADVLFFMSATAAEINSALSSFYRVPLVQYKMPDFTVEPITFTKLYDQNLVLINARLTAANIYDKVMRSDQAPNQTDYGKNQRNLAYNSLERIQSGDIQLIGQTRVGQRFRRQELLDNPRVAVKPPIRAAQRQAGE